MNTENYMIDGHEVPLELLSAITAGWINQVDKLAAGNRLGVSCTHLKFFDLSYISTRLVDEWRSAPAAYLGSASEDLPPGNLDPATSLVVGEVESDSPLAIDFRTSPASIVALQWPHWIRIAVSAAEFLETLDPGGRLRNETSERR